MDGQLRDGAEQSQLGGPGPVRELVERQPHKALPGARGRCRDHHIKAQLDQVGDVVGPSLGHLLWRVTQAGQQGVQPKLVAYPQGLAGAVLAATDADDAVETVLASPLLLVLDQQVLKDLVVAKEKMLRQ